MLDGAELCTFSLQQSPLPLGLCLVSVSSQPLLLAFLLWALLRFPLLGQLSLLSEPALVRVFPLHWLLQWIPLRLALQRSVVRLWSLRFRSFALLVFFLCLYLRSCPVPPFRVGSYFSSGLSYDPRWDGLSLVCYFCQSSFFCCWFVACHFFIALLFLFRVVVFGV